MHRDTTFIWAVAVLLLAFTGSCTTGEEGSQLFTPTDSVTQAENNSAVPGYLSGTVPWEASGEQVVSVTVSPQDRLSPGDGKMTMSVSAVPFIEPRDGGEIAVSEQADGGDFYVCENVGKSEIQGTTYDPAGGMAYAFYELMPADGAAATVGVAWYSLPEDMNRYFLGIGDRGQQKWHCISGRMTECSPSAMN